jgi:hypothetical protein
MQKSKSQTSISRKQIRVVRKSRYARHEEIRIPGSRLSKDQEIR